jgi:hypothetical protein
MKNFLLACALVLSVGVFAQSPATFKTTEHTFGKIPQGKPVTTEFVFTNTSAKPLIVENATAGCGCTTPVYPKEPILKGKTGTIKVTYNAAAVGPFTKDVTVKFAGVEQPQVLNIKGEVESGQPSPTGKKDLHKKELKLQPASKA